MFEPRPELDDVVRKTGEDLLDVRRDSADLRIGRSQDVGHTREEIRTAAKVHYSVGGLYQRARVQMLHCSVKWSVGALDRRVKASTRLCSLDEPVGVWKGRQEMKVVVWFLKQRVP